MERPSTGSQDRLVVLLLALMGVKVIVTVKGGLRFSGILSSATTDGELNITLRQAQRADDPKTPVKSHLLIQTRDLLEIQAIDISLEQKSTERDSFKTDVEVTGQAGNHHEKQLQAWGGDGTDGSLESGLENVTLLDSNKGGKGGAGGGHWDQFSANERLYGLKTDYDDEIYTTKLDRSSADYRAREARAAQLEREILKGTGSLASNAHMAEERGELIDDSGLDEEDKYGAVIRSPDAYIPPKARKGALGRLIPSTTNGGGTEKPKLGTSSPAGVNHSSGVAPPSVTLNRSESNTARSTAIPATKLGVPSSTTPSLEQDLRQFVSSEKERLTKGRQLMVKASEKKEQDTRLKGLLEFSQNFKLKAPMPADIASMLGRDPNAPHMKTPSSSAASSPVPAAARTLPKSTMSPSPTSDVNLAAIPKATPRSSILAAASSLIAEIPPFNPARAKAKVEESASAAVPVVALATTIPATPATLKIADPPTKPTASTSKMTANAPEFVFKPNPNATSFTPNFSPARKPAESPAPTAPASSFFGNKVIKKSNSSMHVKEDFTPFKNGVVADPSTIGPAWPFTGKSYRSMYPGIMIPPPVSDEENHIQQISLHQAPQGMPPQGYGVYQPYQPAFGRFPPGQGPPTMQHIPGLPSMNGGGMAVYPHFATMGFQPPPPPPPQGSGGGGGPMFSPSPQMQHQQAAQQQQHPYIRYGAQFTAGPPPPLMNGMPLGYPDGARTTAGPAT